MIMILTGKAKEDFLSTYYEESFKNKWEIKELEYIFEMMPPVAKSAIIIDWFDSVGYNINVGLSFIKTKPYKCELYISSNDNILGECYEFKGKFLSSKQIEATEQAIIKANKIYNENIL